MRSGLFRFVLFKDNEDDDYQRHKNDDYEDNEDDDYECHENVAVFFFC